MHRIRTLTILAASLAALITLLPDTAQAKRKSPLEEDERKAKLLGAQD